MCSLYDRRERIGLRLFGNMKLSKNGMEFEKCIRNDILWYAMKYVTKKEPDRFVGEMLDRAYNATGMK